jgi:hypothetical protein
LAEVGGHATAQWEASGRGNSENPTTRGTMEDSSKRYRALAEKLERARRDTTL